MIENSELYKSISTINNEFVDDHEFSFSSIGDEFDFNTDIKVNNESQKTFVKFEESDLVFDSSQNFY